MKHNLYFSTQPKCEKHLKAFTLIELSIVLVVIGLIIAGIVGGRSLIRQAQLRGVISEINTYNAAINTFKLQYDQLPGDFSSATTVWPSGSTADGDNNGIIAWATEGMSAWQHLALAGVIPGSYVGQSVAAASRGLIGSGAPAAKIPDAGYLFQHYAWYGNHLLLGKQRTGVPNGVDIAAMSASEAYNVDLKIDDGLGGGNVRGLKGWTGASYAGTCHGGAAAWSVVGDTYSVSTTGDQRAMYFIFTKP